MLPASLPHLAAAVIARRTWWFAAIIVAATFAAYAGSFAGPFVLDDTGTIADNETLRSLGTALHPPVTGTPVSGRPVANLSFAVNFAVSGLKVGSYHVVNLGIHILTALLLFGIVRQTLQRRIDVAPALAIALSVTLLWAVHPLQTAAVTYLSQRAESLMGLLYLLTLYSFIRYAAGSGERSSIPEDTNWISPKRWGWAAISFGACLFGMGTKEVMVTAPVMVFLYDRTFLSRSAAIAWKVRRPYYCALASTWLVLAFLVVRTGGRGGTAGFGSSVPWWAYALSQVRAVALYLRLAAWPHPLVADYGRTLGGPPVDLVVDFAVLAVLIGGSTALLWRRSAWGYLGAWFFVILAPSSSIVPIATEIIAEHRVYLPLAAVLSAAAYGVYLAIGARASGMLATGAALAALALAVLTFARNGIYQNLRTFWADAARKVPENAGAWNNLGNVEAGNGAFAAAEADYRRAVQLAPDYANAQFNLGNVLVREGRRTEALEAYRAAFRFHPTEPGLRRDFGVAAYWMANALADAGRFADAAEMFATAVEMRPDFADAHVNYGSVLAELGRSPEASREFQAALTLEPRSADVHNNFGSLLARSGRWREAWLQFEEALRLKPDYREARDNLERVRQMEATQARP